MVLAYFGKQMIGQARGQSVKLGNPIYSFWPSNRRKLSSCLLEWLKPQRFAANGLKENVSEYFYPAPAEISIITDLAYLFAHPET